MKPIGTIFRRCLLLIAILIATSTQAEAQQSIRDNHSQSISFSSTSAPEKDTNENKNAVDTATDDLTIDDDSTLSQIGEEAKSNELDGLSENENKGIYTTLKTKFIEGNAGFMSLVALALLLGLAFCIERIIYLTLSHVNAHRLMEELSSKIASNNIEGAKELCRNTRGPVASVCYQGLLRISEKTEEIERSIANYGSVMIANLEKGCSWITLFIAIAPSLGFLGTVIGMVMSFDQIQVAGDISPTIVASGMKVALITTIFGIIVALILQLFYNYILTKIEQITVEMEDSAIILMDEIVKYKSHNETAIAS